MKATSIESRAWATIFLITVASDVLAGAVRYYASLAGVASIAYLPKVLCIGWVMYALLKRPRPTLVLIGLYALTEAFVALSNGVQSASILFWLWTLAPMFFALTAPPDALAAIRTRPVFTAFVALTVLCCVGIFLSGVTTLPWVGEKVSVGGHAVKMASASYVGVASPRLTGFGRDSATVALMAGLLTAWVFMNVRSKLLGVLLIVGAGAAIYATTNKTAPVALAVVVVARCMFSSTHGYRRTCLAAVAVATLLPLASFLVVAASNLPDRGFLTLSSFQDRMINTWPLLIESIVKGGYVWLGLGPGGFGSAGTYYESPFGFNVSYADNLVLYVVANVGILGASVLLAYMVRLLLTTRSNDRAAWAILLYILFAGASTDVFESIGCLLFLGLSVGLLRQRQMGDRALVWPSMSSASALPWRERPRDMNPFDPARAADGGYVK
ncbi:hypothetical protein [Caballeronia sp. AZ10_KS36]|uniref:hypothetical protein n=1 Tax=Caballeronia sp. AZ10_KS36 TaxID=2921757 RepID=UPI0020278207|nr:hypothetical protein [Caballeronia sp. AZ10_KS36]